MSTCPECGQNEHEPEQCPAAVIYMSDGTQACEQWFLQHDREGMALAILLSNGTISETEYYEELIAGTEMMHNVSACGLDQQEG